MREDDGQRTILRLLPATGGKVLFDGKNVFEQRATSMRGFRRQMQIIFQDPGGSLNPELRVGRIVGEPLEVHGTRSSDQLREMVERLLDAVAFGRPRPIATRTSSAAANGKLHRHRPQAGRFIRGSSSATNRPRHSTSRSSRRSSTSSVTSVMSSASPTSSSATTWRSFTTSAIALR